MSMRLLALGVLSLGILGSQLASAADVTVEKQKALARLQGVIQSIDTLIAADNKCEEQSACKIIVTGEQACGGPATYAAVTRHSENLKAIQTLAAFAIETRHDITQTFNLPKTCFTPSTPGTLCKNNICILVSGREM